MFWRGVCLSSTIDDLRQLLVKGEGRGFRSMIHGINCMY
jgi:hypothetical protein